MFDYTKGKCPYLEQDLFFTAVSQMPNSKLGITKYSTGSIVKWVGVYKFVVTHK